MLPHVEIGCAWEAEFPRDLWRQEGEGRLREQIQNAPFPAPDAGNGALSFLVLDENLARQRRERAGRQRVLYETLRPSVAGGIHLNAFDAQLQGAFDVAELHDFHSRGQRSSAAG